jgi:hypothetical protein
MPLDAGAVVDAIGCPMLGALLDGQRPPRATHADFFAVGIFAGAGSDD